MTPEQAREVWARARCLYSQDDVESALDRMAAAITKQLADTNPILMCVMQGGLIVTGKLAARLPFVLQLDYLHATRYHDQTRGSDLQWKSQPTLSLENRVVVLVDDILDEGETLFQVREYCFDQGCKDVFTAVLIDKQHDRRSAPVKADFVGLQAEDFYLFGYGMDYKGYLRNAAGIFAIDESDR